MLRELVLLEREQVLLEREVGSPPSLGVLRKFETGPSSISVCTIS